MENPSASTRRTGSPARALLGLLAALASLLVAGTAAAGGSYTIKDKSPQEVDGRWKIFISMNLGHAPSLAHIPMIFTFTQTVLDERACDDKTGSKAVLSRKPLQNQTPANVEQDVGFSVGSGTIFPTTKFDFILRRDRGFEAGEYTFTIKRVDDGSQVGSQQTIHLVGENPAIDRRAMIMTGDKRDPCGGEKEKAREAAEKEKDQTAPAGAEGEQKAKAEGDGDKPAPAEGEAKAEAGDSVPPPVPPKQGGCGCRLEERGGEGAAAGLAVLGLAFAAGARRRRRR